MLVRVIIGNSSADADIDDDLLATVGPEPCSKIDKAEFIARELLPYIAAILMREKK